MRVITIALDVYRTNDTTIALRRIGKGVCPKSFPISRQSYYFLELYDLTHGGEYGTELLHLPLTGGVLEQANIFHQACSVISTARSRIFREKLDRATNNPSKISQQANSGADAQRQQGSGALSFE